MAKKLKNYKYIHKYVFSAHFKTIVNGVFPEQKYPPPMLRISIVLKLTPGFSVDFIMTSLEFSIFVALSFLEMFSLCHQNKEFKLKMKNTYQTIPIFHLVNLVPLNISPAISINVSCEKNF